MSLCLISNSSSQDQPNQWHFSLVGTSMEKNIVEGSVFNPKIITRINSNTSKFKYQFIKKFNAKAKSGPNNDRKEFKKGDVIESTGFMVLSSNEPVVEYEFNSDIYEIPISVLETISTF